MRTRGPDWLSGIVGQSAVCLAHLLRTKKARWPWSPASQAAVPVQPSAAIPRSLRATRSSSGPACWPRRWRQRRPGSAASSSGSPGVPVSEAIAPACAIGARGVVRLTRSAGKSQGRSVWACACFYFETLQQIGCRPGLIERGGSALRVRALTGPFSAKAFLQILIRSTSSSDT